MGWFIFVVIDFICFVFFEDEEGELVGMMFFMDIFFVYFFIEIGCIVIFFEY